MATDQEEGPLKASLEVLLSKLILIILELCCGSNGFFVDRFENDVYPVIDKLMQAILPKDGNRIMDFFPGCQPSSSLFAKQKHSLLLPILHFLRCNFESSC